MRGEDEGFVTHLAVMFSAKAVPFLVDVTVVVVVGVVAVFVIVVLEF